MDIEDYLFELSFCIEWPFTSSKLLCSFVTWDPLPDWSYIDLFSTPHPPLGTITYYLVISINQPIVPVHFHSSFPSSHRELSAIESELPRKKKDLSKCQSELKVLSEAAEKLSRQLKGSSSHMEEAQSSLSAQKEKGQVLSALLRQKENGSMPGTHHHRCHPTNATEHTWAMFVMW